MLIILKYPISDAMLRPLLERLTAMGLSAEVRADGSVPVIFVSGDTARADIDSLRALEYVQEIRRIREPYELASRRSHQEDTVVNVSGVQIGGGHFAVIAGPCSVEGEDQLISIAHAVKNAGATLLRGGAFKPRSSPYSFQGLRDEGLRLLKKARQITGLPIVSEIMEIDELPLFRDVDLIQVGARNMQNYELLKALGKMPKPILLKRGMSCTLQELLMSAEYLLSGGNHRVILCERGIRTFENATRFTPDLAAVPALHELSHLPVIVDPSHSTGHADYVPSMSCAAAAAGADGLIIEVHNHPAKALCDGGQALTPERFGETVRHVFAIRACLAE